MTRDVVSDRDGMIAGMSPILRPGTYHFCAVPADKADLAAQALASFAEDEALSLVLAEGVASGAGLDTSQPMRCITLGVHSALDGYGLTAAVSAVLAENEIACNMIAAYHHDHVFVPAADADRAIDLLWKLSEAAS